MKKTLVVIFLGLTLATNLSFAQGIVPQTCQRDPNVNNPTAKCNLSELKTLAINIVYFLITTAGTITLLFVLWGGVQMLLSAGSPERIKKGKQTLYNALLGFVIVLAAYIIVSLIVNKLTGTNQGFQGLVNFFTP